MSSAAQVLKSNYKKLYRELLAQNKRIYELHNKDQVKKQDAMLAYHKMNLLKGNKTKEEVEQIIQERKQQLQQQQAASQEAKYTNSLQLSENYRALVEIGQVQPEEKEANLLHKASVVYVVENFLRSQRQYQELLERYNPGMGMTQEEKVKKTARRVGLDVPENF